MSLYSKLTKISLGLIMALCCTASVLAQQTPTGQEDNAPGRMQRERGERRGGPGRGREHMRGMMRALRELDLTDAQQQQARGIIERAAESTKPQREALRQLHEQNEQGTQSDANAERAKQLRGEIRESMERAHNEILALLTLEQRSKLEKMKEERKARHEERRARRQPDNEQ